MCWLGFTSSNILVELNVAGGDRPFFIHGKQQHLLIAGVGLDLTSSGSGTMSVTSSATPSMVANSCIAPSTFNEVMAAPSSEDSSTRRMELPMVWP